MSAKDVSWLRVATSKMYTFTAVACFIRFLWELPSTTPQELSLVGTRMVTVVLKCPRLPPKVDSMQGHLLKERITLRVSHHHRDSFWFSLKDHGNCIASF